MTNNEILNHLIEGNKRFYLGKSLYPNNTQEIRDKYSKKQTPIALVISCSDSRAPVELVFDVGIGDLFVIRSAGHILTQSEMASIEYAIEHLNIKLIVVMGHTHCGAVTSALESHEHNNNLSNNMKLLVNRINPAINKAKTCCNNYNNENLLDKCVDFNVIETIEYIKNDTTINNLICKNNVDIIPTKYDIEVGRVSIIGKD